MKDLTTSKDLPLFYVSYRGRPNELPNFLKFHELLSPLGIKVIPIKYDQIESFMKLGNFIFIVATTHMEELQRFHEGRLRGLDAAVKGGKMKLVHLNSFGDRYTLPAVTQKGHYYPIKMPELTSRICELLVELVEGHYLKKESWPGGRRAKLPLPTSA